MLSPFGRPRRGEAKIPRRLWHETKGLVVAGAMGLLLCGHLAQTCVDPGRPLARFQRDAGVTTVREGGQASRTNKGRVGGAVIQTAGFVAKLAPCAPVMPT